MVYYRKYRPQTVAELDLEKVRGKLESILSAKELPHAFLFTGPKGLGKTSAARIIAKAINCERNSKFKIQNSKLQVKNKKSENKGKVQQSNNETIEPCDVCDNCVSITNGSNIDVLEIDAASNRGIDEIRDLREKIKFAPASLRKKVYIIDEVHMLTADAFNALLKTLEEPPSHAVFILCTTEAEKVPGTIASRTFHVRFNKPTRDEILHSLSRIIKGEKFDIEEEVLDQIYKLSEGSFRDAAKILEELVISSGGKKITLKTLEASFKTAGLETDVARLLSTLAKRDLQGALKTIDELSQRGTDFKVLTERLAEKIHDLLLSGSDEFQINELRRLLDLINNSYRDIKFSVLPQIPLELVVVEWCIESTQDEDKKQEFQVREESVEAKSQIGHGMFAGNAKSDNFFAALISAVKRDNHSLAGILRGCKLSEINNGNVQFETKYKFHKDKLTEAKASSILDMRASEILKEKVHVVVNLTNK